MLRKYNAHHERDNEIIKSHTVLGGEILSNFKSLENKGTQFDPKIADIMLELIRDGEVKILGYASILKLILFMFEDNNSLL